MGHVVCRRSGEVFISRYAPKDTIKIMKGDGRRIRWVLIACARHGYDGRGACRKCGSAGSTTSVP